MEPFVLLAGGIIVFGVGIGSFVCGWMACLSHAHARKSTITTMSGTSKVYLGPIQAFTTTREK